MPPRSGAGQKKGLLGLGLQGGFGEEIKDRFASWSPRGPGEQSAAQRRQQGYTPTSCQPKAEPWVEKSFQAGFWGSEQCSGLRSGKRSLPEGQDFSAAT